MSPLLSRSSSFSKFGWFLFIVLLSFLFSLFVSFLVVILSHQDLTSLSNTSAFIQAGNIHLLKYLQIIQSVFLFVIPPVIFAFFVTKKPRTWLQINKGISWQTLILLFLLMLSMFPVTNFLAEINQTIQLPDFLSGVYDWMLKKEQELAVITEQFLKADSFGEFSLNFIMIALIPAIGEELLFRGVLQKIFSNWTKNVHWGIFIAAFLFSAIHMQFLTFLPRFFLGIVFGYLLVWTRSLWVPILAHFFNNGFAVIVSYLTQKQNIGEDVENIGQSNNFFWLSLFNLLIVSLLLFFIYKFETGIKFKESENKFDN